MDTLPGLKNQCILPHIRILQYNKFHHQSDKVLLRIVPHTLVLRYTKPYHQSGNLFLFMLNYHQHQDFQRLISQILLRYHLIFSHLQRVGLQNAHLMLLAPHLLEVYHLHLILAHPANSIRSHSPPHIHLMIIVLSKPICTSHSPHIHHMILVLSNIIYFHSPHLQHLQRISLTNTNCPTFLQMIYLNVLIMFNY